MTELGGTILVLAFAAPLLMALLVPGSLSPLRILPWAALPGLAAVLFVPHGQIFELPMLLLGISVQLDPIGAVFLGFGALLWLLAGAYALSYMADSVRAGSFSVFWLITLAGTLGAFIAADVVTFYLSFAMLSFAAYGLIIHDRTASARRAGRIYILLAVIGETALLAAFMLAATAADSLLIGDVREGIALSPWRGAILAGLIVGFGIKAGLVPLHVWLPLAHPEAPTPASAALSGIIVKAGILGLMRFLPFEAGLPMWGEVMIVFGLFTAYYGVIVGLAQTDTKAMLAYSTLSQLGLLVTVLGSGAAVPDAALTLNVATLYATHHGLAKAALFLSVGVVAASGARWLRPVMIVTGLTALAIAGLPFTGGALAKLAIKGPLGEGWAGMLVTLSAAGTALLMLRFLFALAAQAPRDTARAPAYGVVIPWVLMVVAAIAVPWALFPRLSGESLLYAATLANIWASVWPILVAAAAAILVVWQWKRPVPSLPPGDIVVFAEALARHSRRKFTKLAGGAAEEATSRRFASPARALDALDVFERQLQRWAVSGSVLVVVVVLFGIALAH